MFCSGVDTYQFNTQKYVGKDSLNIIRRDLLLAAKHCGYERVTSNNSVTRQATTPITVLVVGTTPEYVTLKFQVERKTSPFFNFKMKKRGHLCHVPYSIVAIKLRLFP